MRAGQGDPVQWVAQTREAFVGRVARGLPKRVVAVQPAAKTAPVWRGTGVNVTRGRYASAIPARPAVVTPQPQVITPMPKVRPPLKGCNLGGTWLPVWRRRRW